MVPSCFNFGIIFLGIILFIKSGDIALGEAADFSKSIRFSNNNLTDTLKADSPASTVIEVIDEINKRLISLESRLQNSGNESSRQIYLLSSVITRIGSVIILLFLVQIFASLYRYNIRLSAWYDARADSLKLTTGVPLEIVEKLMPLMTPETVDFGKTPPAPTAHAVELVRSIFSTTEKEKAM